MLPRERHRNEDPIPEYDDIAPLITLKLYHGGKFFGRQYVGGTLSVYDYVDLNNISIAYIDKLCEELGYNGMKMYYMLGEHGFKFLSTGDEILQFCLDHYYDRVVDIYLDNTMVEDVGREAQFGSSNLDDNGENDIGSNSSECEEFKDSDYDMNSEEDNVRVDDDLYNENVDEAVEWAGGNDGNGAVGTDHSTEGDGDEEIGSSGDDFISDIGSDGENGKQYPVFSSIDTYDPKFELGMIFSNKSEFRMAVHSHAIKTKRSIKIAKNDKRRIYAKCATEGCEWRIHALKLGNESTYQIREYYSKHKCGTSFNVKNLKSSWLSSKYVSSFRSDPKRSVKGFRHDVIKDIRVNVSKYQAYRARNLALDSIGGKAEEQYALLWDYAEELRRSNPGSTVILSLADSDGTAGRRFGKFYVCLEALKRGFLSGCRPLIGVDGCHLKGPHGGVLLAAVGIDPNNNSFPIAYAVVSVENKETWEWFLMLLRVDLGIVREYEFTFMSDKQKGLLPAFEHVFPTCDNRFCVRHLHGNMKRAGFRGLAYKKILWKAAMASTVPEFDIVMKELGKLDKNALEWFSDKHASQWSRSHFNTFPKCDILLNNLCESFNSTILSAREKPILSMLEEIRELLMIKLQENRDKARRKWHGKLCPKIKKIVEKNVGKAADCIPIKSTDVNFEISCYDGSRYVVDLGKHTCSCRKWDLTGIPCKHAMSAICSQVQDPEDFVDKYYWVDTFVKVYEHAIFPVNGSQLWKKTNLPPPLPPNPRRSAGRPKRARRLEVDEPTRKDRRSSKGQAKTDTVKMKRQQLTIRCRICGEAGHNRKGCKRESVEVHGSTSKIIQEDVQHETQVNASQVPPQLHEETSLSHGDIWTTPPSQVSAEPSLLESQESQQGSKLTARKRTLKHAVLPPNPSLYRIRTGSKAVENPSQGQISIKESGRESGRASSSQRTNPNLKRRGTKDLLP